MTEKYYQDGIRLPMKDDESPKVITMQEHLMRHIEACTLLGEAHGMLSSLSLQMKFQDEHHQYHVEQCIEKWVKKMNKFVELEIQLSKGVDR